MRSFPIKYLVRTASDPPGAGRSPKEPVGVTGGHRPASRAHYSASERHLARDDVIRQVSLPGHGRVGENP